jgi:hypothetical protein
MVQSSFCAGNPASPLYANESLALSIRCAALTSHQKPPGGGLPGPVGPLIQSDPHEFMT